MTRALTPALRHQQRVLAQQATKNTLGGQITSGSQYELQLFKLAEDRRRLKAIQSIQKKIALKAELLPEYAPWIEGVLAGGKGGQDDVLTTLLVWHIDVGEYARAVQMATYALRHRMTLPDQYSRDIPTLLLDEFASAYLHGKLANDPEQALRVLEDVLRLTQDYDAPDQARAKLFKAFGYAQRAVACGHNEDLELTPETIPLAQGAYQSLSKALALFEGVGVKKDLEKLERRLKKTTVLAT